MIVPKFWAEARAQHREKGKQVTIRRYGWSDASQTDAQANADARASDALARVLAGEKLHRRDHKIPYNGAEGLPIREEVISTHGDAVITRNSYGAHCLNTPNVLFADVDFPEPKMWPWNTAIAILAIVMAAVSYQWATGSDSCCERSSWRVLLLLGLILASFIVASLLVASIEKRFRSILSARPSRRENAALAQIREFAERQPSWGLRVYRTPAGFRVLATHATFNASQLEVAQCFSSLGVDSVYRQMCLNQQCFRARLTAKPWRAGVSAHMRPRPGVWPIKPEQIPVRAAWVAEYERAASGFAACRYVERLGSAVVHPDVRSVIELHDSQSRALSQLPLA
jgi:hypothetical protein